MEQYQTLMFAIVSMVGLTGAVLLTTISENNTTEPFGPSGMAGAVGTAVRCVRNFNCQDTGQMCCDQTGCYCAPKKTGYQYAWNTPGKRYFGQEKTCLPSASKPGIELC